MSARFCCVGKPETPHQQPIPFSPWRRRVLRAFLSECIEANGLLMGGGINDTLSGYFVAEGIRASATDTQREIVRAWLEARPEFEGINVEPLSDAWYGHGQELRAARHHHQDDPRVSADNTGHFGFFARTMARKTWAEITEP